MTVELFEGCWALTRGGDGVPQEVVGPVEGVAPEWWREPSRTQRRSRVWKSCGRGSSAMHDIIAVFPDRASAEAALAGEPLPVGDAEKPAAWMNRHGFFTVNPRQAAAHKTMGTPMTPLYTRPAEPAQAGVDWEQRRWEAMLAALTGIMADPRSLRFDAGKQSYDVAAEANAILAVSIADATIAAAKGGQP